MMADDKTSGDKTSVVNHGWQCPVCMRVNAPHVDHCPCVYVSKGYPVQPVPVYPVYPPYWINGQFPITC